MFRIRCTPPEFRVYQNSVRQFSYLRSEFSANWNSVHSRNSLREPLDYPRVEGQDRNTRRGPNSESGNSAEAVP